jgi:DNA transformation protein and related proteins
MVVTERLARDAGRRLGFMHEIKGDRLFVNLSASRTRRRLKGHGFGVRKVHSNGRNQAVVIHTATGQHRDELHALFADVIDAEKTG